MLLEALREHNRDAKIVFAGSRLQYGHPARVPVSEDAPQEALCLHAIHKQTVEQYLALYRRLFGIRYTVARITNPYGPGQPAGRTAYGVINRLIHLAIADRALTIYGDGVQLRDYVHVDDVVAGAADDGGVDRSRRPRLQRRQRHRHAPGRSARRRSSRSPAAAASSTCRGRRSRSRSRPAISSPTSRASQRELGWRPAIALRDGLERTVAFYRARAS